MIAVVFADILLAGVILLIFAFFHHVLPAMINNQDREQVVMQEQTLPTEQTVATVPSEPAPTDAPAVQTEPPAVQTEPDNRTEWQIKFADQFSEKLQLSGNSYKSDEVSVTIETVTVGEGKSQVTYHVADIYIASMDNFTTYTANNEMRYFGTQDVLKMDAAANAIISISGDFLTYQKNGFLMRNREIYKNNTNVASICVLYEDGVMETYDGGTYSIDEVMDRGAVQVWSFGPVLLENGKVREHYNCSATVSQINPRSAIGYYEPGHYCFVVVDGRQEGYSIGMKIPELAAVFEELGCTSAYNLDGGGSAVMVYENQRYSSQSNGGDRGLGDILVIRESEFANKEEGIG